MIREKKTRFLPAVEPSTAGFISDSVPTGEPSPAGFISDYVHVHQRGWMCFIYLPTNVGRQAPTGSYTPNELKIEREGGGEGSEEERHTLANYL